MVARALDEAGGRLPADTGDGHPKPHSLTLIGKESRSGLTVIVNKP
jgi:hypothetical protein